MSVVSFIQRDNEEETNNNIMYSCDALLLSFALPLNNLR